jgi:hypothetical protein
MLINLVLALRALGRNEQAHRASRRALELNPDYATPYHAIWLALDDLLDGDADGDSDGDGSAALARLDGLDSSRFDDTNRYLFALAQLLVRRRRAKPAEWAQVRSSTSREFVSLTRRSLIPPEDYGAVIRTYHRAVRRMGGDYGRARGLLWKLARRLEAPRKQR